MRHLILARLEIKWNLTLQYTANVLTEHHWQVVETIGCDRQVGTRDKSGDRQLYRDPQRPVALERATSPHALQPNPARVPFCKMWDDYVEEPLGPEAAPPAEAKPAATAAEEKKDAAQPPAPETTVMGEDPKQLLYKHWIRPKFFQYGYLYDYQHNYYNDVITYMDRRNKGLPTERPRAQTWGERVLRTYLSKAPIHSERTTNRDTRLLRHISTGAKFQRYHIKSLISRKYSNLGFNQVSI